MHSVCDYYDSFDYTLLLLGFFSDDEKNDEMNEMLVLFPKNLSIFNLI